MLTKFTANKKGFTLVALMIVVAIIGILAALAIPAFIKYINRSKAAEAQTVLSNIRDGGQSYFESDQQYSPTTDGDQPWHAAGTTPADRAGMPVASENKTFPGGTDQTIFTHSDTPTSGSKAIPDEVGNWSGAELATAHKLNLLLQEPTYFAYTYISAGEGAAASMEASACHQFSAGGGGGGGDQDGPDCANAHTVIAECEAEGDAGELGAACFPLYTLREFQ